MKAVRWYRLAAEQGHAYAQYNLGLMYRQGEGVPQDDAEAVRWYRLAAEQGDAVAQFNLGCGVRKRTRVSPRTVAEAVRWCRLAAEQGDAKAAAAKIGCDAKVDGASSAAGSTRASVPGS